MSSNEVAVRVTTDGGGALSVRPDQIEWDPQQQAALAQIRVADAPVVTAGPDARVAADGT